MCVRQNKGAFLRHGIIFLLHKEQQRLVQIFPKTKTLFINVCTNEVEALKSVKIQFSILVKFHMKRDGKMEEMEHYVNRMQPVILNEHNISSKLSHGPPVTTQKSKGVV